jgi:hypothetical protein
VTTWFYRQHGTDFFRRDEDMALKETPTIALPGGTPVVPGHVHLVDGVPTVVPAGQSSVAGWAAAIGGSPVIATCDSVGRAHGAFLPSNSPHNMNLQRQKGCDVFET